MSDTRPAPPRAPELRDYFVHLLGVPIALAFLFESFEIRLVTGMSFLSGMGYLICHITGAWLGVDLGSRLAKRMFASRKPPLQFNIAAGFFIAMLPMAFYLQWLGDLFGGWYPSLAAARVGESETAWSLSYIGYFIRFSLPALPLFLATEFGFRYLTGVNFYGYPDEEAGSAANDKSPEPGIPNSESAPLMAKLGDSRLAGDSVLWAVKAEGHYVQVWADNGKDLIRFRFQDAIDNLADCRGIRVHRSWWINPDAVERVKRSGRSMDIELSNGVVAPVSLMYRQATEDALSRYDKDSAATAAEV